MVSRRCPHYPGPRSSPPVRERAHILKPQFASPRAFARALAAALALLAGGAATASAADPVDATIDLSAPAPGRRRRSSAPRRSSATRSARAAWSSPTRTPDRRSSSPASTASSRRRARATPPTSRSATSRSTAPPSGWRRRTSPASARPSRTTGDDGTTYLELGAADRRDPERRRRPEGRGQRRRAADQRHRRPARRAGRRDVHAGDRRAARVRGRDAGRRAGAAGDVPAAVPTGGRGSCRSGEASLVRFRDGDEDRLGWRVLAPEGSQAFYDAIVDARTGKLIRRVNRVRSAAQIRHFDVNPRAEPGDSDAVADVPAGWLGASATTLNGPYVARGLRPHRPHQGRSRTGRPTRSADPWRRTRSPPSARTGTDPVWDYHAAAQLLRRRALFVVAPPTAPRTGRSRPRSSSGTRTRSATISPPRRSASAGPRRSPGTTRSSPSRSTARRPAPTPRTARTRTCSCCPNGYPGLMQMYLFGSRRRYGRYDGAMDASMVYHEYAHGLERAPRHRRAGLRRADRRAARRDRGGHQRLLRDGLPRRRPSPASCRTAGRRARCASASGCRPNIGTTGAERDPHRGPRLRGAAAGRRERVSRHLGADDAGRLPLQRLRQDPRTAPSRTPTARSGGRRCGRSAPRSSPRTASRRA